MESDEIFRSSIRDESEVIVARLRDSGFDARVTLEAGFGEEAELADRELVTFGVVVNHAQADAARELLGLSGAYGQHLGDYPGKQQAAWKAAIDRTIFIAFGMLLLLVVLTTIAQCVAFP